MPAVVVDVVVVDEKVVAVVMRVEPVAYVVVNLARRKNGNERDEKIIGVTGLLQQNDGTVFFIISRNSCIPVRDERKTQLPYLCFCMQQSGCFVYTQQYYSLRCLLAPAALLKHPHLLRVDLI